MKNYTYPIITVSNFGTANIITSVSGTPKETEEPTNIQLATLYLQNQIKIAQPIIDFTRQ